MARAQSPARATCALMTSTLSSGTCPRLHLLPPPLAPASNTPYPLDSCRSLLPASAPFPPPPREARVPINYKRGHRLCAKPLQNSHCSSGGITPPRLGPYLPPSALCTRPAGGLGLPRCADLPTKFITTQACRSGDPLPGMFWAKILTSQPLITWGSAQMSPQQARAEMNS